MPTKGLSPRQKAQQELRMTERRLRVTELVREGWSQREIAKEVGCSASTVNKDFKHTLKEWRGEALEEIEDWANAELQRLNRIHRLASEGWVRSLEPEVTVQKITDGSSKEGKTVATRKPQCGDPRFLAEMRGAIIAQARILGLCETSVNVKNTNIQVIDFDALTGRSENPSNVVDGKIVDPSENGSGNGNGKPRLPAKGDK